MEAKNTEYVVFDVETTGLSAQDGDRIIEIAAARVRDLKIVDTFEFFVNPGRGIPMQAQKINNITPDMVADAPSSAEILPQFVDFVGGACLCGQNVKFDLNFVCNELARASQKLRDETPAIDTIKMARYFMPQLGSFRLSNLAQAFGVKIDITHRALADVELTVEVLRHLLIIAEDQKMTKFHDILREFGVQKPVFKLVQDQGMLF
ncbi:MAG: 3'-5' exonuclease [Victivallaceae bacterium]|nr:3'-5' exonuclease [Victivallaceae bacterium]